MYLVLLIMSNGHEAKILTPYIPAMNDVALRLYFRNQHGEIEYDSEGKNTKNGNPRADGSDICVATMS